MILRNTLGPRSTTEFRLAHGRDMLVLRYRIYLGVMPTRAVVGAVVQIEVVRSVLISGLMILRNSGGDDRNARPWPVD